MNRSTFIDSMGAQGWVRQGVILRHSADRERRWVLESKRAAYQFWNGAVWMTKGYAHYNVFKPVDYGFFLAMKLTSR